MDLDDDFNYKPLPTQQERKPTIMIKIKKNVAPQKIECDDDSQKRGYYKFHTIFKLNQRRMHKQGSRQVIQSFLNQGSVSAQSPTQRHSSSLKQIVTPQNDHYSESTNDNSLDETVKESTFKYSGLNSPNLEQLCTSDIFMDSRLVQNTQNNCDSKLSQSKFI